MRSNRSVAVLGFLIVVLLAAGGFLALRGPGDSAPTDVAGDPSATPSEMASDAVAGGAGGVETESPSPSPSEVGSDAAAGGAGGAGGVEVPGGDDPSEDSSDGGDDPVLGGGDGDGTDGTGTDGTDGSDGSDGTGDGDGDIDSNAPATGSGGDGGDGDSDDDDDDSQVAGSFDDSDVADADDSGDLPNTGGPAVAFGALLMFTGLTLLPRRLRS